MAKNTQHNNNENIFSKTAEQVAAEEKLKDEKVLAAVLETKEKEEEVIASEVEKMITIVALQDGYIHPQRLEKGDVATIPAHLFSERWMEKVTKKMLKDAE